MSWYFIEVGFVYLYSRGFSDLPDTKDTPRVRTLLKQINPVTDPSGLMRGDPP